MINSSQSTDTAECIEGTFSFHVTSFQWLNYSKVGGGTPYWQKSQCCTKTTVTKTKYAHILIVCCEPVCQITEISLSVQERQFEVVER